MGSGEPKLPTDLTLPPPEKSDRSPAIATIPLNGKVPTANGQRIFYNRLN
ncbi:MAG: hypothetical protein ACM37W_21740 [Actinomycetota bacterium]